MWGRFFYYLLSGTGNDTLTYQIADHLGRIATLTR